MVVISGPEAAAGIVLIQARIQPVQMCSCEDNDKSVCALDRPFLTPVDEEAGDIRNE